MKCLLFPYSKCNFIDSQKISKRISVVISMVKELMHDLIFLAGKSESATKEDLQVAQDLRDTLMAIKIVVSE